MFGVVRMAERLERAGVEDHHVTSVRYDMMYINGRGMDLQLQTVFTPGMRSEVQPPAPLPSPIIQPVTFDITLRCQARMVRTIAILGKFVAG